MVTFSYWTGKLNSEGNVVRRKIMFDPDAARNDAAARGVDCFIARAPAGKPIFPLNEIELEQIPA